MVLGRGYCGASISQAHVYLELGSQRALLDCHQEGKKASRPNEEPSSARRTSGVFACGLPVPSVGNY